MSGNKVVILQPHYLPWMGYFTLMDIADIFVFYDDVQFEHQSWQQRNRIKSMQGKELWLTVPIIRNFGQLIKDTKINTDIVWRKKHQKTIEQSYSKAPYFEKFGYVVKEIYDIYWLYLADLNIYMARILAELLDVKLPEFIKSSELKGIEGEKTDRVLSTLKAVGGTEYISGLAAMDYLQADKLHKAGIELSWFDYQHPSYPQIRDDFIPYLSVIDLLFNVGEEAIEYIRRGYQTGT